MQEHDAAVMVLFKDLDLFYLFHFETIPLKQHIEMRAAEKELAVASGSLLSTQQLMTQ